MVSVERPRTDIVKQIKMGIEGGGLYFEDGCSNWLRVVSSSGF
jgi:hypothetical protein